MATKEKEVKREVKFEYCSELSVDEYKHLRKHANFPKLSDEQIEFIFKNNGWRYCCKVDSEAIAMCRFLCTAGKAGYKQASDVLYKIIS